MTTQQKSLMAVVAGLLVPIVSMLLAVGASREQLSQKLSRAEHVASIDSVRSEIRLATVRDSARFEQIMERATDAACAVVKPRPRYCR